MNEESERLETIIAEAYQVVGALASMAGVFDDPQVERALDILSGKSQGSMLPFTPEPRTVEIEQIDLADLARMTAEMKGLARIMKSENRALGLPKGVV